MAGFFENIANKIKEQKRLQTFNKNEEEIFALASFLFSSNNINMSFETIIDIIKELSCGYDSYEGIRVARLVALKEICGIVMQKKDLSVDSVKQSFLNGLNSTKNSSNCKPKDAEVIEIVISNIEKEC